MALFSKECFEIKMLQNVLLRYCFILERLNFLSIFVVTRHWRQSASILERSIEGKIGWTVTVHIFLIFMRYFARAIFWFVFSGKKDKT